MMKTINIARDYTPYLGGRYVEDGEGNGTTFREEYLMPALKAKVDENILIVLDGAAGYPSSFLEEAFGGLVREHGLQAEALISKLEFQADQPGFSRFIGQIQDYIKNARPKAKV